MQKSIRNSLIASFLLMLFACNATKKNSQQAVIQPFNLKYSKTLLKGYYDIPICKDSVMSKDFLRNSINMLWALDSVGQLNYRPEIIGYLSSIGFFKRKSRGELIDLFGRPDSVRTLGKNNLIYYYVTRGFYFQTAHRYDKSFKNAENIEYFIMENDTVIENYPIVRDE
jgi:hypothetical protein